MRKAFIDFWSARYRGYDDDFYEANAGQELTERRILDLFEWKNGTPLSGLKRKSVLRNFVARRDELGGLRDETPSKLLAHFSKGGAIWRIFFLHCWQPKRFPIYDQHAHGWRYNPRRRVYAYQIVNRHGPEAGSMTSPSSA